MATGRKLPWMATRRQPHFGLSLLPRSHRQRSIFIENPYLYHPAIIAALCAAKRARNELQVTVELVVLVDDEPFAAATIAMSRDVDLAHSERITQGASETDVVCRSSPPLAQPMDPLDVVAKAPVTRQFDLPRKIANRRGGQSDDSSDPRLMGSIPSSEPR